MTDFSWVEMTELSSVQLYIWRKRKMTVPCWGEKSTQEACDLRVGILGTERELKWEVSDRLKRVTGHKKKKKKKKRHFESAPVKVKAEIYWQQIILVFSRYKVQPQRCGWHPAPTEISAPHTTSASCSAGDDTRGSTSLQETLFVVGKKNKTETGSVRSRHMNQK